MYVNVGKTIIHNPPVITIFCLVGFVETMVMGGAFMALIYPHEDYG